MEIGMKRGQILSDVRDLYLCLLSQTIISVGN